MIPKFQAGDRVNHASVACKKNGTVEEVIERTVYAIYRVRWCSCTGDYYEHELVPVVESAAEEERL